MFHGDLLRRRCRTRAGYLRRANDALAEAAYWQRLADEGATDDRQRIRDLLFAQTMTRYARRWLAAAKGCR